MAKNALRIGSVARIGIYLHWTFILLIIGIFVFYLVRGNDLRAALVGIGLILAVFVCVILHELGHSLTAARFGVPTKHITIYPIGGVAQLRRIPDEPMTEFWIAIAGPAVNLVIAAILLVILRITGASVSYEILQQPGANPVGALMWLNLFLAGFNLLPAFPMDGGRVLRALLATRLEYGRATEIAANTGQFMAILFGLLGILSFNPILLFIAMFVYIGAQQEAKLATIRSLTQGLSVRQAMMTRFLTLSTEDTLGRAVKELLNGSDQDFPVVRNGEIIGVLTRREMMKALSESGRETKIGDVISSACFTVEENSMLDDAFVKMQENRCSTVPVLRGKEIVGLLTLENVGELMMVTSAIKKSRLDLDNPLSS